MTQKKKRQMTTIISLVVVLVLVCIGYFVLVKHNKDKEADTSVNVLQLDTATANKLEISNSNGAFSFEKSDDTWVLSGNDAFIVDQLAVQKVVNGFADIKAAKSVVDNKDNLGDYGLDAPAATGTLTLEDGTSITISFGDTVPVNGGYYGILDSSDGVYSFSEETLADLFSAQDAFEGEAEEETTEEAETDAATE